VKNGQGLAAELRGFKPLDRFTLVRDDFGLPDKSDGHDAHRYDAYSDNKGL
jgi:hypothetical protein